MQSNKKKQSTPFFHFGVMIGIGIFASYYLITGLRIVTLVGSEKVEGLFTVLSCTNNSRTKRSMGLGRVSCSGTFTTTKGADYTTSDIQLKKYKTAGYIIPAVARRPFFGNYEVYATGLEKGARNDTLYVTGHTMTAIVLFSIMFGLYKSRRRYY